ncbi:conserved exported hypothetical protein [Rubrivivax sp. A210]|uniref:hypothetical protein n=1 Tax=Rubrivivax sp. A210 TaxID=2772301 RepID=UPI001918DF7B|nr:hypothetical protein [Rubrivivax sp. A210]CAD5372805.1 conserved exported hypothetical protein [Rubrivivax sp. A210]
MSRILAATLLASALLFNSGCAVNRATATADPSLQWDSLKSLHVKKLEGEDGSVRKLIVEKFRASGFAVSTDPEPAVKPDAVVTYHDKWMWDITMYLLELTITLHDPRSDVAVASGNSLHTSLTRKSPKEMVDEVVDNILKQKK